MENKESEEDKKLLKTARDGLAACISDESTERAKMKDDLRFCTLDQWPAQIRAARENDPNGARPCLTIDKINQYIVQVENDMRHNRPSIKPRPVDDKSDPDTAQVFAGLIRHIEDQSNAPVAYITAGGSALRIGLGYFRVTTDYVSPESDAQEPRIVRIPDTFSVHLGPHIQPDGSDAEYGYIIEEMPLAKFKRDYPKAKHDAVSFAELDSKQTWRTEDYITVVEYFYIHYTNKELLFLADGATAYADEYDGAEENITGRRPTQKKEVKWVKMTGAEILDKRDWLGKYIPIVEVVGKEAYVDGKRVLWGLVRPAKDNLRMYNYWASAATEKIALSPKNPYVGAKGQFNGVEEQWRKANVENRPYLEYNAIDVNGNALPRPERSAPAPVEVAIIGMMNQIEHDVQTSLGMFKAAVGESESQQSGKAILALQRESDTGTFHFQDNLSLSIQHCGRILIDLIPKVIDTRRVLRILGEDGESQTVTVDPKQDQSMMEVSTAGKVKRIYNLGVGTFDVTVTTGPSYTTARQEAATILTELANSAKDPASAAVMRYLAIKNSDFKGSDEMVRMLKALLPPPLNQPDGQEPIPPQAMAKMQEMGAQIQQMGEEGQKLLQENQQLKSGAAVAHEKVLADHDAKMKALQLDEAVEKEKARIAREKFEFEKQLALDEANLACDLAERKAAAEHNLKSKQHDFERTQALAADPLLQDAAVLPQVAETMAQMTQLFTNIDAILQRQTAIQESTLTAQTGILTELKAPKRVSLGNVRRGADGAIAGAEVRVQ